MKILCITPIPTEKLFELLKECEALHAHISELLKLSYIDEPKEASSDPKAEASAEPKQEASSDEYVVDGIPVKKYPTKPFEMVIE